MYQNIPAELRALPQWVLWRYEQNEQGKLTKMPYTASGYKASVTNRSTWCSFEQALAVVGYYNGIGLVLTNDDPFTIIDLDNKPDNPATPEQLARHTKIYESFNSYTERSVSGTGVHIIVRGRIPAGVHRDHVEVYSTERYMACTGDILRNAPIVDYQQLLDVMYGEMKPVEKTELIDRESHLDDAELVDMAMRAANADKFNELCQMTAGPEGSWKDAGYTSQSEADLALLSILAYYTQDNEQVRRVFRMTGLGKRDKATKDNKYLNRTLELIRSKQPPPVDFSALIANANKLMEENHAVDLSSQSQPPSPQSSHDAQSQVQPVPGQVPVPPVPGVPPPPARKGNLSGPPQAAGAGTQAQPNPLPSPPDREDHEPAQIPGVSLPPGLVGELAQYIYSTAIRPVPEIALAAALALVAGVAGRSYNVSGTGLNQYIILLARTGAGKEGATMGIENLIAAVRPRLPMVDQFMGPAAFASGQALIKVLNDRPCFLSVLGEFGLTLQQISDGKANSAEKMLRRVLLDLYGKSGWNRMLRPSVYSDVEKNTNPVQAPNVTILGESTPETFFDGLDASHIAEGLIPRFSVIEYTGPRPPRNAHANCRPSEYLCQRFADLVAVSITTTNNNVCCPVKFDDHSQRMLDEFDAKADSIMNASKVEVELQVWNRAHLKALKLSALLAVGINPHTPIVTGDVAQWAIQFVESDCALMTKRFRDGDVGQGDSKQFHDVKRAIEAFFKLQPEQLKGYEVNSAMVKDKIIPYRYLLKRTASVASFRHDKLGATSALKRTIQSFLDSGMLIEVPKPNLAKSYNYSGVAYGIGHHWRG